jgi:2-(1,2-epoxy-1,2-dihydrophenyl)acetyl-CoA isomerase
MSQQEAVLLDIADGIARIRMNRPKRVNALDNALNAGLNEVLLPVDLDPSVKVVTLAGEGRAFMAGGDVSGHYKDPENGPQSASKAIAVLHQISGSMRRIKLPIMAGAQDAVAGVGLTARSAFAIAAAGTNFIPTYTTLGTNPEGGSTWLLTQLLGPRRAFEFFIPDETASSLGLVNRVVPAGKLSRRLSRWPAKGPAFPYASVKRLRASRDDRSARRAAGGRAKSLGCRDGDGRFQGGHRRVL